MVLTQFLWVAHLNLLDYSAYRTLREILKQILNLIDK